MTKIFNGCISQSDVDQVSGDYLESIGQYDQQYGKTYTEAADDFAESGNTEAETVMRTASDKWWQLGY